MAAHDYGTDIYTEPDADPDTLANLGPLAGLAGTWEGISGSDDHPVAGGTEVDAYVERYDLQPIDPQTNGPQLFYGLRYHVHIVKPGDIEAFHDQVGYWLWEPAAETIRMTVAIPRAQVLLASGPASADATQFEVCAAAGSEHDGIVSNPFLDQAFHTASFRMEVSVPGDGTWSYEQETMLVLPGRTEPFAHVDRNTLTRIAEPTPNPLVGQLLPRFAGSLGIGSLRHVPSDLL